MVKSKLALIIDSLFISFLISITSLIWIKGFIKNANLVYFFLIIINISSFIVVLFILYKSNGKKIFKDNNDKFLNNCLKFITLSDNKTYQDFIEKLINCIHIENYLFKLNNNFLYINLKTPLSSHDYFLAQELFLSYKNKTSKLYFIYYIKEKSFDDVFIFSSLNSSIISSDAIIKLMAKKEIYPIEKENKISKSFKQRLKLTIKNKTAGIQKSHFKEIFFSGISLLFLSLITPFSNYYLIIGTILITLSIITLFKKNFKTKEKESDFLFKEN